MNETTQSPTDIIEVAGQTITVTPKPRTQAGALDGFEVECTCGERTTSSVFALAQEHAYKHGQWHVKGTTEPQHCCDSDCDRFATVVLHIEETLYNDEAYDAAFCAEHAAETLCDASTSVEFSATEVRELV